MLFSSLQSTTLFLFATVFLIPSRAEWTQVGRDWRLSNLFPMKTEPTEWKREYAPNMMEGTLAFDHVNGFAILVDSPTSGSVQLEAIFAGNGSTAWSTTLRSEWGVGGGLIPSFGDYFVFYKEVAHESEIGLVNNLTAFDWRSSKFVSNEIQAVMYDHFDYLLFGELVVFANRPMLDVDVLPVTGLETTISATRLLHGTSPWTSSVVIRCDTNDCHMTIRSSSDSSSSSNLILVMEDQQDLTTSTRFAADYVWSIDPSSGAAVRHQLPFQSDGVSQRVSLDDDGHYFFVQRRKSDKSLHVFSVDTQTHSLNWTAEVKYSCSSVSCCSPVALHSKALYFVCSEETSPTSSVFGYDIETGKNLFSEVLQVGSLSDVALTGSDEGAAGVVVSGVATSANFSFSAWILRIDGQTGKVLKSRSFPGCGFALPAVMDLSDYAYFCLESLDEKMVSGGFNQTRCKPSCQKMRL